MRQTLGLDLGIQQSTQTASVSWNPLSLLTGTSHGHCVPASQPQTPTGTSTPPQLAFIPPLYLLAASSCPQNVPISVPLCLIQMSVCHTPVPMPPCSPYMPPSVLPVLLILLAPPPLLVSQDKLSVTLLRPLPCRPVPLFVPPSTSLPTSAKPPVRSAS